MDHGKKAPGQAVPPKGVMAEKLIARKKRELQRDKGIATKKKREAMKTAQKTTYKKGSMKPN